LTLNSALRTGSIEGLHYYSVALAFSEGGYPEWFGTYRFDRAAAADPKRPCGPPEAQSVLRAIVRHVVQPLWNFVSPMDQNGPMEFIGLVFQWLDLGVSESFVNGMVCKVHVEFQKAFSGWLDGAVKDPPKIAVLPRHLQALIDDEVVMVKRVHEFQRRFSGGAAISGSGRRGEEAQPELWLSLIGLGVHLNPVSSSDIPVEQLDQQGVLQRTALTSSQASCAPAAAAQLPLMSKG
jgi:hypothetical protein